MLRAFQMGLNLQDLTQMSYGFVCDMMTELSNDGAEYAYKADQSDIDAFFKS